MSDNDYQFLGQFVIALLKGAVAGVGVYALLWLFGTISDIKKQLSDVAHDVEEIKHDTTYVADVVEEDEKDKASYYPVDIEDDEEESWGPDQTESLDEVKA
jgi:hypothetical protein